MPENALFYTQQLHEEIQAERRVAQEHKALKNLTTAQKKNKSSKKISTTDSESSGFHKDEHKEVFAYCPQVVCDKHG
ncbi:hypothetical protein [Lactococcus lactis]|uniref:hypothetical protein n=1 Tax=Lactococcus lactis TaxID=1358 RepID=UPI00384AE727